MRLHHLLLIGLTSGMLALAFGLQVWGRVTWRDDLLGGRDLLPLGEAAP